MSLRNHFRPSAARGGALALLLALSQAAQASIGTPQLVVSDAAPVVDSFGNQTLRFHIEAATHPVPVTCLPSQPDCNAQSFRICVDFTTVSATATPDVDFVPRSGRIDTVLITDGVAPEFTPVGTIDVTVLGDQIVEGTESIKLQLKLPPAGACPVQYSIERSTGVGLISDGVFGLPDLAVQQAGIGPHCQVQFRLKNQGTGTIPEAAYTSVTQASQVRVNVNGVTRFARLIDVDPQRQLKTPGAVVAVLDWFQLVGNPPKLEGSQQLQVAVDANGTISESLETNNALRAAGSC